MSGSPSLEPGAALNAAQIAELVSGQLEGDSEQLFTRVTDLAHAEPQHVVFFRAGADAAGRLPSNEETQAFHDSKAGLALVDDTVEDPGRPCVRVANPSLASAILSRHFEVPQQYAPGVHASAVVANDAQIDAGASIGPLCVVSEGAVIGPGVVLVAQVHVGPGVILGAQTILHPHVSIYERVTLGAGCVVHSGTTVGAPGFGYVWSGERHLQVPQVGGVTIGNGVEIGTNSCIDSGTFQPTEIGDGCILDNHVQVGHNAKLGRAVVLCGKVGISGSTKVGDGAVFGGQAATVGHLKVGAGAKIAARGAIMKDVPPGAVVAGFPAVDIKQHQRDKVRLRRLLRDADKK
ncbi:MAG: UDP-3-O-(3-hydroxymyristoyl)glucosamine N-acyltransferase [Planctomycetota bacterium]|nr:UDP-3-O-(3-hydroxymyristoyl)glucosamine N-acyltransferase [Planctomycetota bacterium]